MSLRHYLPSFLARSKGIASQARRTRRTALERLEDRLVPYSPLSAIPMLHSNPAAAAKLYLDFDGHYEAQWGGWFDPVLGTHWGGWLNLSTPAFDTDGDPTTFSDGELAAMRGIWARVAEDFAPFNVDVTTVDPGDFADRVGLRVAIGGSGLDWYGSRISGVAIGSSYTDPNHQNVVYVFPDDLSGDATLIANAAAHEAGHSYGLGHQSTFDALGTKTEEYNTNGDSTVAAPIMGDPSDAARSLWWSGLNTNDVWQDDMAVIASANNGFGYRADDHGDTFASASGMTFGGGRWTASGIIEQTTDRDAFRVFTGGRITVRVDPAAVGPNLDATVSLFDSAGNLLATADPNTPDRGQLGAELTVTVPPGTYDVVVGSHGSYGDVGQYTVSVTPPPTVQFTTTVQTVGEGGTVTIAVALSSALGGLNTPVTIPFTVTGTATGGGVDFMLPPSPLVIPAGQTSATLTLSAVNDALHEPDETVVITLGTPTNAVLGTATVQTVTITDNDSPHHGAIQFDAASQQVAEGGGTVRIQVRRTGGTDGTVTAPYVVTVPDGLRLQQLATPGADFQGPLSGTLTFGPGVDTQTLSFTVVNDSLVEADTEFFTVTLRVPTGGATLGTPSTILVGILDDDLPLVPNAVPDPQRLRQAAKGFAKSTEHYVGFVDTAYRRFLGRAPDDGGLRYWVGLMQLYETSNHAQGLRQEQVEAGFLVSQEYTGRYGGIGKAWIRGIYRDLLGREGDPGGIDYWMARLADHVAPAAVALGFTASDERLRNRIADTYRTLLDRAPDLNGLDYWASVFKAGGTTEDIVAGLLGSQEYYSRQNRAAGNPARWVRAAYLDVLNRPAGRDEFDAWLRFLGP